MLTTKRLLLRQWTEDDFVPFANMCADKDVMEFFPSLLTPHESNAMATRIQSLIAERGWGFWALEVIGGSKFIGFVGLHIPSDKMPFSPCVEIGWRIAKPYWDKGYATEAAHAALEYAFSTLDLEEVVSFTTVNNKRSQAVMKKLGMLDTGNNFMHPDIQSSNPLCEHVLYKITRSQWSL